MDLITTWSSELSNQSEKDQLDKFKESLSWLLEEQWLWTPEEFLMWIFVDTIKNAKAPDSEWNLHRDYGNVNRAAENLMKVMNPKKNQTNINIWLFHPPKDINY